MDSKGLSVSTCKGLDDLEDLPVDDICALSEV